MFLILRFLNKIMTLVIIIVFKMKIIQIKKLISKRLYIIHFKSKSNIEINDFITIGIMNCKIIFLNVKIDTKTKHIFQKKRNNSDKTKSNAISNSIANHHYNISTKETIKIHNAARSNHKN